MSSSTAGDVLEFIVQDDGEIRLYVLSKDVTDLKNLLPIPKKRLSIDQMNDIILKHC